MAFALTGVIAWQSAPPAWIGTWTEPMAPGRELAFAYVKTTENSVPKPPSAGPAASSATMYTHGRPQFSMWRGNFTVFLGHGRTKQIMDEFTLQLSAMPGESAEKPTQLKAEGRGRNKVGSYTLTGALELPTDRLTVTRAYDPKSKTPPKARPKPVVAKTGEGGGLTPAASAAGAAAAMGPVAAATASGGVVGGSAPVLQLQRRSSSRPVRRNRMFDDSGSDTGDAERAGHGSTSAGAADADAGAAAAHAASAALSAASLAAAGRKRRLSSLGGHDMDGSPFEGSGSPPPSVGAVLAPHLARAKLSASPPYAAVSPSAPAASVAQADWKKKKAAPPAATTWVTAAILPADVGALAGELYEGEMLSGLPHGHGTIVYRNGLMFEGQLQHGREHGKGVLTDADDMIVYQGDFADGEFNGVGTYYFGNGDRYTGQWKDGLWHGRGEYLAATGAGFDGEWADGLRHGQGILKFPDGSIYNGMWRYGQRHGKGELITTTGFRYRGNWSNDVMDGKGEITYPDGSRYEGNFRDGKRDGRGTYSFLDGQQYTGRWVADAMDAAAPGTLLMPRDVRISDSEWMIPLNIHTDFARIHMRAGFDKLGQ